MIFYSANRDYYDFASMKIQTFNSGFLSSNQIQIILRRKLYTLIGQSKRNLKSCGAKVDVVR